LLNAIVTYLQSRFVKRQFAGTANAGFINHTRLTLASQRWNRRSLGLTKYKATNSYDAYQVHTFWDAG